MVQAKDRRQFQRFDLPTPIPAQFGNVDVFMLDIGVLGAMVEHDEALGASGKARLTFLWEGQPIELVSQIVYSSPTPFSDPDQPAKGSRQRHSGLRFEGAIGNSDVHLRQLIRFCATRTLGEEEAKALQMSEPSTEAHSNADAIPAEAGAIRGFDTYRLQRSGGWKKTSSDRSEQPEDGFTVPAGEPHDHVQLLCRTFESASEAGRQSVRALAELSVSSARRVPPRTR